MLHTDAMKDVYPSKHAEDLTWQKLSLVAGGDAPPPRTKGSLAAWGNSLLLFGGLADNDGEALNETRLYAAGRQAWEIVSVAGGPIAKRSGHTAHVCSLETNCSTVDGKPRMFVFGGWGLRDCGHHKQCLRHRDDLWALDLTASPMTWTEVAVNAEQPRPHARKEHSSAIVNGSTLVVFGPLPPVPNKPAPAARPALPAFSVPSASLPGRRALLPLAQQRATASFRCPGGSAFVPDGDEFNSYGWTTKQVNDVWRIDLSGADGFTWHPVCPRRLLSVAPKMPSRPPHEVATPRPRRHPPPAPPCLGHQVHTVGDRASPREGQASTLLDGRYLVIIGGYQHPQDLQESGLLSSVHVLDTATDPMVWTRPVLTGEAPGARHGHVALTIGDEIYVIGGFGDDGYHGSLHLLSLKPAEESAAPPSPPPPPA